MASVLLRLNLKDFVHGLVTAVFGAAVTTVQEAIATGGFDFATYDWKLVLNVAIAAGLAYVGKKFFSDSEGKVFGKV